MSILLAAILSLAAPSGPTFTQFCSYESDDKAVSRNSDGEPRLKYGYKNAPNPTFSLYYDGALVYKGRVTEEVTTVTFKGHTAYHWLSYTDEWWDCPD